MRELGERRPRPAHRPVDEHGATVGRGAEVAELPVAVEERARGRGDRVEQRPRVRVQRRERARHLGCDRGQALPAVHRDLRHRGREPERGLARERVGPEERVAVGQRDETDRVGPAPARRVERGEVHEELLVLLPRDGRVARRHHESRHVAHQDRADPSLARGTDGRVIDAQRREIDDAALPREHGAQADVTGLAHDPVRRSVDVLEHELLVVDHDPLEARARLRVGALHRHA